MTSLKYDTVGCMCAFHSWFDAVHLSLIACVSCGSCINMWVMQFKSSMSQISDSCLTAIVVVNLFLCQSQLLNSGQQKI